MSLLEQLIQSLRIMPGIGQKSAQRIAFHLLQREREGALHMAKTVQQAMEGIHNCSQCRNLTEDDICHICANTRRDASTLCIVESPADVITLEQATSFQGMYFVLMGHLSPLDGIGPEDIGMDVLEKRLANETINEIILATNTTVEGEATAFYINDLAQEYGVNCSRIATIAEYVESPEIYQMLKDMGVDIAQGYSISHPKPWFPES